MIVTHLKILTFILCFLLVETNHAAAFDNFVTHPSITKKSIDAANFDKSKYLISNLGIVEGIDSTLTGNSTHVNPVNGAETTVVTTKNIAAWLRDGSNEEDIPLCRASNHFHNPLKPWGYSGMNDDTYGAATVVRAWCNSTGWPVEQRKSNVVWATGLLEDGTPASIPDNTNTTPSSPNNWKKARSYFYTSLTAPDKTVREENLARTFQAVGQVMHLLEDMAVPAHVRNDFQSHLAFTGISSPVFTRWFNNRFEKYVKDNDATIMINAEIKKPEFSGSRKLTDFWDTLRYRNSYNASDNTANLSLTFNAGLAEYTNANFVSDSTIFADNDLLHKFPNPRKSNTQLVNADVPDTLNPGNNKTRIYYSVTTADGTYKLAAQSFLSFEKDTFSKEIPVMDDNVHADYARLLIPRAIGYSADLLDYFFRGVISLATNTEGTSYVIKNKSKEDMSGRFDLYYDDINDNRHLITWSTGTSGMSIPAEGISAEVSFETPTDAKDKTRYMLVFQGKLGNEEGAVVGREVRIWREEWNNDLKGNHPWLYSGMNNGNNPWLNGAQDYNPTADWSSVGNVVSGGKLIQENSVNGQGYQNLGSVNGTLLRTSFKDPADGPEYNSRFSCKDDTTPKYCFVPHCWETSCYTEDFGKEFPIVINEDTWLSLKIDAMTKNVPVSCPGRAVPAYQGIQLSFKVGPEQKNLYVNFTLAGNEDNGTANNVNKVVPENQDYSVKLYELLEATGYNQLPVLLESIKVGQQIWCSDGNNYDQHMEVNYIRLMDR